MQWGSGEKSESNPYLYTRPGHVDSVPNIQLALDGGCRRLGHAVTLMMDPQLLERVALLGIVIECCLSSNRWRVGGNLKNHPITAMLAAGGQCTLSTDNRFLGNSTTTREAALFIREVGGSWETLGNMMRTAGRASFYFAANRNENDEATTSRWLARYDAAIAAAIRTAE
jgi:adenosine deaminase